MYVAALVLLLLVLPLLSVAIEAVLFVVPDPLALVGKWFTFWGVGVRLFLAGASQVLRPEFTSEGILGIKDQGAVAVVRELGFANLSIGTVGLLSLALPEWIVPAAVAGGMFYLLAGAQHAVRKDKNVKEWTALVTDLFMFLVLAAFVMSRSI